MPLGDLLFELQGKKTWFNMDLEIFVQFNVYYGMNIKAIEKDGYFHFTADKSNVKLKVKADEFRSAEPLRKPLNRDLMRKSRFSLS